VLNFVIIAYVSSWQVGNPIDTTSYGISLARGVVGPVPGGSLVGRRGMSQSKYTLDSALPRLVGRPSRRSSDGGTTSGSLGSEYAILVEANGVSAGTAGSEQQNQTQDARRHDIARLIIQSRTVWHIPKQMTH
jgi:hypothetical protein